ncbi:hypothetical protein ABKN59_010206 [Abortiporus biennis]
MLSTSASPPCPVSEIWVDTFEEFIDFGHDINDADYAALTFFSLTRNPAGVMSEREGVTTLGTSPKVSRYEILCPIGSYTDGVESVVNYFDSFRTVIAETTTYLGWKEYKLSFDQCFDAWFGYRAVEMMDVGYNHASVWVPRILAHALPEVWVTDHLLQKKENVSRRRCFSRSSKDWNSWTHVSSRLDVIVIRLISLLMNSFMDWNYGKCGDWE